MLKLNKLEKQTIRPAAEVYDVCAQLCSVAVQFEDEKNSVMLIGTYGNRRTAFAWAALYKRTKWDWK